MFLLFEVDHANASIFSRFDAIKVVSAGDMSTSSINSTAVDLDAYIGFSCQAVFSGSPVGTLKLQISDDILSDCASVTNWSDYTNSSYSLSAAGNYSWNVAQAFYRCMRVVYTKSSGTGTLNVTCGKKS